MSVFQLFFSLWLAWAVLLPFPALAVQYWPGQQPVFDQPSLAPGGGRTGAQRWILYGDISAVAGLSLKKLDDRTALVQADAAAIAALPDSLRARRPVRFFPLLDVATRLLRAGRASIPDFGMPKADGTGVLLALVDTGIDVGHPDFLYPDGSSRFYRYWDQTVSGARHDGQLDMGTECDAADINLGRCNLDDEAPLNGVIAFGHGTHVAGIAASGNKIYHGFAPGATLVGVRAWFDEASILLALDYLRRLHQSSGRPMVVNLSLGTSDGSHDGNTVLEKWIEANSGPGFVFVAAAGNEATAKPLTEGGIHTRLSRGNADGRAARWLVTGSLLGNLRQAVTQWYANGDLPDSVSVARVHSGGGTLGTPVTLSKDELNHGGSVPLDDGINLVYGRTWFKGSDTTGFAIALSAATNKSSISGADVIIRFLGSDTPIDGWVSDRTGSFAPTERDTIQVDFGQGIETPALFAGDNTSTITVPATGRNVIAVGSFVGRVVWPSVDGNQYGDNRIALGVLSPISSHGPSRDGRTKPELVAPGQYVSSTMSRNLGGNAVPDSLQTDAEHMISYGTSMASPMAAGIIARMLQRNPLLTVAQVRDLFGLHSFQPYAFGDLPDNRFGIGTVDVTALFADGSWQQPEQDTVAPVLSDATIEEKPGSYRIRWKSSELANSEIVLRGNGERTITVSSFDNLHEVLVSKPNFAVNSIVLFGTDWAGNRSTAYNVPLIPGCGCRVVGFDDAFYGDMFLIFGLLVAGFFWRRHGRQV